MARRHDHYDDADDYYYDDEDDDDYLDDDEDDSPQSGYDDEYEEDEDEEEYSSEDEEYPEVDLPEREAGPLEISEPLRRILAEFRSVAGGRKAPKFEAQLVTDVEDALESRVPDPVVALWTSPVDELLGLEISTAYIVDNTADAHSRGVPSEYIAFARHPDDHAFYCYSSREQALAGVVYVTEWDNLDNASSNVMKLEDWLGEELERHRELLAEGDAKEQKRADAQPTPTQLKNFRPALD